MARRNRAFPQSQSTANLPGDLGSSPIPPSPSSNFLSFPRSSSPSSITGFLSKPSKWFSRPSPKLPPSPGLQELPRLSSSSSSRRPTISGPTDPRPIPPSPQAEGRLSASRSVLDLSLSRAQTNGEGDASSVRGGLGELRSVSRKGWSRSVDDLGKFPTTQVPSINTSNIKVSTSPPREDILHSPTKAMIEAYRQNSPSPHSLYPHYPFPTIQTNPSGSSTTTQTRSVPDVAASPTHGWSNYHAPFQPSKLASPSSLAPEQTFPPPQASSSQPRNRSVSSFEREREKARRTGHSFPLTSGTTPSKPQNTSSSSVGVDTTNTQPLMGAAKADPKRTSQIVHHAGFINRHPDFQQTHRSGNTPSAALAKGWKPYKALLKGSKLFFYKLPGDRIVAVKELFPQGMESVVDERPETVEEEQEPLDKGPAKEKEDVKKRTRVYRGRATHPELFIGDDGSIVKASSDALIHEAVFGTSFTKGQPSEAENHWRRFASSVVLCLPQLIGKAKFEGEFIRYASYAIDGADEADRSQLQSKVAWLSEQYLRHQGISADETIWGEFRTKYVSSSSPLINLSSASGPRLPSISSSLTHPQANSSFAATVTPPRPSLSRPSVSHRRFTHGNFWDVVEQDGLTNDVFLKLDSSLISRSLSFFHRKMLARNQERLVGADLIEDEMGDDSVDHSGFEKLSFPMFFGSEEQPQWLTLFIVAQVLNASSGVMDVSNSLADPTSQLSKAHVRAELIGKWARVGEHSRIAGDLCTWKAIQAALCSRPIARLDRAWRRVEHNALRSVQTWNKRTAKLQVGQQNLTPWGGDVRERITELLQKARVESGGKDDNWNVVPMQQILDCVEPVVDIFSPYNRSVTLGDEDEDISRFASIWQTLSEKQTPRSSGLVHYLAQSLAAEPRDRGRFEPYYWQRPLNASTSHTLVPLLFVEPLPTVTLINRDLIYRGKKDSMETGTHPGLDAAQVSRMTRMKSYPEVRRSLEMKTLDSHLLVANNENNGPVLRLYDGELLLMMPNTLPEPGSRPPSTLDTGLERRPSQIRVTSAGLERKTSVARRGSLPSLSQSNSLVGVSEPTSESSLRVIVKAGTLDRLVDVLISGVEAVPVSVADDNGEMPLREGKTRMIKLDRAEFRSTWWQVFRSFISPLVFFELLRKRFLLSDVSAGTSTTPRLRLDIFSTLSQWIENGGALDALGDSELFDSIKTFLVNTSITNIPNGVSDEDRPSWIELETVRRSTLATFTLQVGRPKPLSSSARSKRPTSPLRNYGRDPPSIDDIDPETLVENLDALAAAALRSVTREDFFNTVDLLEVQSVDRTGWFVSHEPSTNYDDIEIQTMYSHLQQIEPSPLISEMTQESFYKLLPPSIRGVVRAHAVIRKWAMTCIVAPHLGLWKRQARTETLLRAVEVCRLRMADTPQPASMSSHQSVRSFVETALISALVSPESRAFALMWLNVAAARGTGADSIATLFSKPVVESTKRRGQLIVDVGWILERILEVISMPNIIDTDSEPPISLVNFEKRRLLCDLVVNAVSLAPSRSRKEHAEVDLIDIDRLNHMHRDVAGLPFDTRLLKDEAYHEGISLLPQASLPKKNQRPLVKITQSQQEKHKRDKLLRERLLREKKVEQQRSEKREDDLNRAMQARYPNQPMKRHRSRRTMSSAFFHLMRPLSSAFSSENIYASAQTQRRTAVDLDFEPTGKPALVIGLVGATVAPFVNNVRLYTFYLTTEDGGRYLLQASTRADLNSWLSAINKTAKSSSAKRLTYIANAPKPQLSDHILSPSQAPTRHPTKVFGVGLEFLLQREAGGKIPPGAVPRVLEQCLLEIEARGLQEVGLYRIPGAASAIHALKEQFDSGEEVTFFSQEYVDIWAVCDIVKSFFRELPNPIFPEESYHEVLRVMKIPDFEERLMAVRDVVHGLPVHHFTVLRRICEHLERVTDYEENNHMTAQALSVLFNPTLLRSPLDNFGIMMQNMTYTSQLLQTLITHFHRVFDETEADQDDEAENHVNHVVNLHRADSQSSSVPTDAIDDHDPDLEPPPPTRILDTEMLDSPVS